MKPGRNYETDPVKFFSSLKHESYDEQEFDLLKRKHDDN